MERKLFNFQSSWKPINNRINPVQRMPEMYDQRSYAHFNMAFNGEYEVTPRIRSSSGCFNSMPVNYGSGQYSFVNPYLTNFPGLPF
jgi:hypothetical protein